MNNLPEIFFFFILSVKVFFNMCVMIIFIDMCDTYYINIYIYYWQCLNMKIFVFILTSIYEYNMICYTHVQYTSFPYTRWVLWIVDSLCSLDAYLFYVRTLKCLDVYFVCYICILQINRFFLSVFHIFSSYLRKVPLEV